MRSRVEKTQFYDSRGLPSSISAAAIMNMAYTFNNKGNLISRSDLLTGHKEDFTYDAMNRLTAWNISKDNISQTSNSIDYNPTTGTITTKSDVGFTFGYGEENGKPHALTSLSGKPDKIPNSTQTVTYTDFKKVKNISLGSKSLVLDYGVDEQRRKGIFKDGSATFTRYYSGNYEEEVDSSGKVKKIHYISGGDGLAGIYINDDGNNRFYSTYCDYQGSLLALTDMNGVVKERYAYDPWGNRRNPVLWKDPDARTKFIVDRGYTLHEHLDGFGLINMNGRVYDPLLGMFLSPDPYVQAPGNWLNYNRYGYCYGNPLSYTDPNGEFFFSLFLGPVGAAIDAACWGAVIGAGVSAITYSVSTLVSGQSWNNGNFWKSIGIGAFGGALGGGLGYIGSAGALGTFGNSMGYNLLSGISNTVLTNVTFGNDIGWDNLLGMTAGSFVGSFLPNFKAVNGSAIKNTFAEIGFNTARGATTGFVSGSVEAVMNENANLIWQNMLGGAISGAGRSSLMNIVFGAPYKVDKSYGTNGLYRSGGITSLVNEDTGITLGRNMFTDRSSGENSAENLRYHENFHVQQQEKMGWSTFYAQTIYEYIKYGLYEVYRTSGTLEYDAERYMYKNRKNNYLSF